MNKNIDVLEEFKNSIAELSRIVEETAQAITLSLEPSREFFISITDRGPWILCEMAIEAAEEGETGDLDWFCQEYLKLKPGEWPYAEEALREGLRYWKAAEQPIHYVGAVAHRKKQWLDLDVDHVSNSRKYPGSIFRKRKAKWNKEPEGILSLDVMLDMDSRRVENDKEAWLENDGILENEPGGIIGANELDTITDNPDPFEHEGHANSIDQLLPRDAYKVKEWIREANYIQKKFLKGYYTETFTLKDEQDKLVFSSFTPRLKRKGAAPNLTYSINDIVDANETSEKADEQEYVLSITNKISWPKYTSKRDDRTVTVIISDAGNEKYYKTKPWDCKLDGIFLDNSLDLKPEKRFYREIIGVGFIDIERAVLKAGLTAEDVLTAKAWVLRPFMRYCEGTEINQYRPGWFEVGMSAPNIAALLGWDTKKVNASMKRIKRRVKGSFFRHDNTQGAYVKICGKCKYLEIRNIKRQEGNSYDRQYNCKKGNIIKSLYSFRGNCFKQGNTKDVADKMLHMAYLGPRKSKIFYK